ncbi:all7373 (plasmid) [Nostoc sp. PCC 7120 = FACHB-418]|nr:all7373 [Nostoc sp. PCC 7120 = FACHB-418]
MEENMNYLTVEKVHKIIELATVRRLHQQSKLTSEDDLKDSKTLSQELVELLHERQTPGTPISMLSDYIYKLSDIELSEAIALMLLGRGHSDEQPSDFPDLVNEAQGVPAHYLIEKAPLAKYLRSGLEKLNLAQQEN